MTMPVGYNPSRQGCSFKDCGSQKTVTIDGRHGRRCAEHPPEFDPQHAAELAVIDPGAALDYCRGQVAS